MKIRSILALAALVLTSCSKQLDSVGGRTLVNAAISIDVQDTQGWKLTKLTDPMDPQYENQIIDLWVLQYSYRVNADGVEVGDLIHKYPVTLDIGMTAIKSFEVPLYTGESRIVVFANTNNSEMPLFPEGTIFPATLAQLREHVFAGDMMIDFADDQIKLARMIMCGSEIVNVTDGISHKTQVNIILSRLNCKLRIALYLKAGSQPLSDVKVRLRNGAMGFTAFQGTDIITSHGDYGTVALPKALSSERQYIYFYTGENIVSSFDVNHPESGKATYLEISATKGNGTVVTRNVPITAYGSIYRNSFYNMDLALGTNN